MKFLTLLLIALCLVGCSSTPKKEELPFGLEISEVKPDKMTALTKQNVLHLAQVYDLSPFLFTKKIQIKTQNYTQSHPVLTLGTRDAENPKKILASLLHEELHWWAVKNQQQTNLAILELKKIYPKVPAYLSQGQNTTHLHMIICYLELRALEFYLGKKEARGLITTIMRKDKAFPWIYYQVLYKDFAIARIVKKYNLLPKPLI